MDAEQDDFIFGEDLESLYNLLDGGFLEEDFEFEQDLNKLVAEETSESEFVCESCSKVCKTKRGLTRHKNAKHASNDAQSPEMITEQSKVNAEIFHQILNECTEKCFADQCLPEKTREKFSKQNLVFSSDDALQLLCKFQSILTNFNGDAEKFYAEFYGLLMVNLLPSKFEDVTLSNILLTEVANHVLIHLSGGSDIVSLQPTTSKLQTVLTDREINSLQYIAGYIIHKLHSKFKFSKNYKSEHNMQTVSILQACKVDCDDSQTYVNARDRGGLWKVNKQAQTIFIECEKIFRVKTSSFITSINSDALITEMFKNCLVISNYRSICYGIDPEVDDEISYNTLEKILILFTRVRAFSYAKDIREKHKMKKKQAKKSSLRTQIKKSSSSTDMGH